MTNAKRAQLVMRSASTTDDTTTRDYWLRWGNLVVVMSTMNRLGGAGGVVAPWQMLAAYIVDDVIGRFLRQVLEIASVYHIATPQDLIEHATWWEGTSARGIMDFIDEATHGRYYWAVWERGLTGMPKYEYRSWNQFPRYIVPPEAGILELAGGADDLYNEAVVAYTSSKNVVASERVDNGQVQELDAAQQVRRLIVDLTGEGPMSIAKARDRARSELDKANLEKLSGTGQIWGPLLDQRTGRMVEPWEIRAGGMIAFAAAQLRMRSEVRPFSTVGNRNPSTFRLTETIYDVGNATAQVTLDGGQRSLYKRVRISRRPPSTLRRRSVQ